MSDKSKDVHPMNVIPSVEQKPKIGLKITELLLEIADLNGDVTFMKDRGGNTLTLLFGKNGINDTHTHIGSSEGDLKMLERHLIDSLNDYLKRIKG